MTTPTPEVIKAVMKRSTRLIEPEAVERAFDKMAQEISERLSETDPVVLCTLIGGIIPAGHILTRLDFPLQVDYIHATRYRNTTQGFELELRVEPHVDLAGRTVIIIDDILDKGVTLQAIIEYCKKRAAKAVYTAVLVEKHTERGEGGLEKADFTGVTVDDQYVFGFGMDYKRYLRNAPGIFAVDPEDAR